MSVDPRNRYRAAAPIVVAATIPANCFFVGRILIHLGRSQIYPGRDFTHRNGGLLWEPGSSRSSRAVSVSVSEDVRGPGGLIAQALCQARRSIEGFKSKL